MIVKSLENRESVKSEDWLIIITSDHGGLKRKHGGQSESEKTIPIILNGSRFKEKKIETCWQNGWRHDEKKNEARRKS